MSSKKANTSKSVGTAYFTESDRVRNCIKDLNQHFAEKPLIVSDVLDPQGHQYVHLVQKGGGVLGIALVGYTYVLEQMGIRFMRLAGTSAGAINTAMMTIIKNKEDAKSEDIVEILCNLDFFKLVDGHPFAQFVISKFVKEADFSTVVKKWFSRFFIIFALLFLCDFVTFGLQPYYEWARPLCLSLFVITGLYTLILLIGCFYFSTILTRLKDSGYGINPGDFLYDWIKDNFKKNGVNNVSELNAKAGQEIPGLHLRDGVTNEAGIGDIKGDVTFITSELVTENKLEFPKMCYLFRKPEDIDKLHPAGFVKASMSIPMFYESYYIKDIPCKDPAIKDAWSNVFDEDDPPSTARFVDGGILSNFPINLFFNSNVQRPRLPVFGIDLDDSTPDDSGKHAESWSLGGYMGRMFNTIRDYYDKDFLLKNKVMQKGIGVVPLSKFNWLNFFIQDPEKLDMFATGAEAAAAFLKEFDWAAYKNEYSDVQDQIPSNTTVQNTLVPEPSNA